MDEDHEMLARRIDRLRSEHQSLANHVKDKVDPVLLTLGTDIQEIRVKLGEVATTRDVMEVRKEVSAGNANLAAALASVPGDKVDKYASANSLILIVTCLTAVVVLVLALHH